MSSVTEAVQSGDKVAILRAMRDSIAEQLDDGVAARDLASLTKRLMDIVNELTALEESTRKDLVRQAADVPDEAL